MKSAGSAVSVTAKAQRTLCRVFQRLKKRDKAKLGDRLFPSYQHELFNRILDEEGLKFDREGQRRTFYSLRHTYICLLSACALW